MAALQTILSSFLILLVTLADAHDNPDHAHDHDHAKTPHAHDQHAHDNPDHANNHAKMPHAHDNPDHAHNHAKTPHAHTHHAPTPHAHKDPATGHGAKVHAHAHIDRATSHEQAPGPWKDAHATFYGGAEGTLGGACGYEEKDKQIYGKDTTALSTALFDDGTTCGACFEIKCDEPKQQWCKPGQPTVTVTATDYCPPGGEGWCNSPKEHFDMSQPAFLKIAEYKAGIVPVKYRRIHCHRHGGIRYTVTGNPFFNMVGITNVGGAGDMVKVEVKVGSEWKMLKHNFGDKWDTNEKLVGAKLTFKITTSEGKSLITEQAAPENWQFGQTFQGGNQLE